MGLQDPFKGVPKEPKKQAGMDAKSPQVETAKQRPARKLPLEEGLDHLRNGRQDHAVVALRIAVQREPGRFAAVRGLATAYLMSGDVKAARSLLDGYTHEQPMSAEGWRLAAQLEWKLNHRPRAVEILYSGLKRLPQSGVLRRQLAVFLAAEGRIDEAANHGQPAPLESVAEKVTTADHDWLDQIAADPVLLQAILTPVASEDAALPETTREMLRHIEWKLARLLEAQPDHADRQLLLARVQSRLDSVPAAMLSLQRALRLNPKLAEAHRLKAKLHARIGEIDQAIEVLQGLVKRGLHWPDVLYELAALERKRGNAADARSHLYSAIRLNPQFSEARELLERCAA
jgi:predicted Zn-dependent protease